MCDSEFKEAQAQDISFLLIVLLCFSYMLSLVLPKAESVCVGLAAGFGSPLRFCPLEGAVSNGKRLAVE